jgi:uncharacterized membrane protein YphA (DoxX/SURF4 family)
VQVSSTVALAFSLLLALVFAWAGATKVFAPERWRKDLQAYRLSRPLRALGLLVVPWLELLVTVAALGGQARWAGALALALLLAFSLTIVRARILVGSNQLACGCFGGHATRDYRLLLLRNASLGAVAAYVAGGVPLPMEPLLGPVGAHAGVVMWVLALVAGGWILWQIGLHLRRREAPTSAPPG